MFYCLDNKNLYQFSLIESVIEKLNGKGITGQLDYLFIDMDGTFLINTKPIGNSNWYTSKLDIKELINKLDLFRPNLELIGAYDLIINFLNDYNDTTINYKIAQQEILRILNTIDPNPKVDINQVPKSFSGLNKDPSMIGSTIVNNTKNWFTNYFSNFVHFIL